jgi:hypothetical protein
LLALYQEIEDCCVSQAIAPHETAAPQECPTARRREIARPRATATAAA